MKKAVELLEQHNIKATPNRILVVDALLEASSPLGLIDLETNIRTMERSSVLRVLSLLLDNDVVHIMEDGKGVSKYELCNCTDHTHASLSDLHFHFFCENCGRTFCLEQCRIPDFNLPDEFEIHSANFMLKGICPDCR